MAPQLTSRYAAVELTARWAQLFQLLKNGLLGKVLLHHRAKDPSLTGLRTRDGFGGESSSDGSDLVNPRSPEENDSF